MRNVITLTTIALLLGTSAMAATSSTSTNGGYETMDADDMPGAVDVAGPGDTPDVPGAVDTAEPGDTPDTVGGVDADTGPDGHDVGDHDAGGDND